MIDIYPLLRPLFFLMDGEDAHNATLFALKSGLYPRPPKLNEPSLETELLGLRFPTPVGLAAGFDKNAEAVDAAFKLGFGFVETGTVTPKPQNGNPRPRIFRDPDNGAVINRMGFPNKGMHAYKENVEKFLNKRPRPNGVLGLNIGMNKEQTDPAKDYCQLIRMLGPMADYITINISSPNTPGLRNLQQREPLLELLGRVSEERSNSCGHHAPPLFLKLAPDLSMEQQEELANTVIEAGVDGLILTNTTLERPDHLSAGFIEETGGLSGAPLTDKSTDIIKSLYRLTNGKVPIIGAGGIMNGEDAYKKIRAGASLVQFYSSMVFQGPLQPHYVNKSLAACLKRDNIATIKDAVGLDA